MRKCKGLSGRVNVGALVSARKNRPLKDIGHEDDTEGWIEKFRMGLGAQDSKDGEGLCVQA